MKTRTRHANSAKAGAPTTLARSLQPTPEEIRQRAHEIYLARGGTPGNDLEDWLRAEQQLKQERAAAKVEITPPMMRDTQYEASRQIQP